MKALIFAAGKGERMRPLTLDCPKPLLPVGGKMLIEWHLEKLAAMQIDEVVINTSWLASQFAKKLGDGDRWGLRIHYVYEGEHALETGGGMLNALDALGDRPFIIVNGDVYCDYDLQNLALPSDMLAHLVMVDVPAEKTQGDFDLSESGLLLPVNSQRPNARPLTYSGIGIYEPKLLEHWSEHCTHEISANGKAIFKLAPILTAAIKAGRVSGEYHSGHWTDVGTPQRLHALDQELLA